ncbi:MAG: acetate kinase [Pseudomonadota bacterium]
MNILVINAGSSSLKYKFFDMNGSRVMAEGMAERIGEPESVLTHRNIADKGHETARIQAGIRDHRDAMLLMEKLLTDPAIGVIHTVSEIAGIGHRVVQGGEAFREAVCITDAVKLSIRENNPLAPLHNPANLVGIDVAQELFKGIPNVAVFDTQFHQTMPPKAFMYGLPYDCYTRLKIRRYGFHGTSHNYVSREAAKLMGKPVHDLCLITIHLGNGCSIAAVKYGQCIDTSMGMTPLSGVMMGTRTGDIDPAIVGYLLEQTGMSLRELDDVLNRQSGLKGISGSNDMRDIHARVDQGDPRAALALDMFTYQVKKYIGSYAAALGHLDAVVFTAGIGENDARTRSLICQNLLSVGIELDPSENIAARPGPFAIHSGRSRVQVWVIPTNEELQIAKETEAILKNALHNGKKTDMPAMG